MRRLGVRALHLASFAVAFLAATSASASVATPSLGSLVWFPTGIAIAGLWLLGLRAAWVVVVCTALMRSLDDYPLVVSVPAGLGSAAEAIVAVLLLRRLQLQADFARLRDVLVLLATASVAPAASILTSWASRVTSAESAAFPFYSGWDGWWRMNVLGTLTIVPPTLVWVRSATRATRRTVLACLLVALVTAALVALIMVAVAPGAPAVMLLTMVLPIALYAAMRLGPRGAASTATAGAVAIVLFAQHGLGAFESVQDAQRHVSIQIFLVALVSVPLVFGALIAEREAKATLWLESEGMRRALLSVLPDVVYKLDAEGTFLDAIVPAGEELPVPAERLIGRRIHELASPTLAAQMLARLRDASAGRPSQPLEYPVESPRGRRDREMRCVRLPHGELLGVVRDITARKQAERQLSWQATVLEMIAAGQPKRHVLPRLVEGIEAFLPRGIASILLRHGQRLYVGHAPSVPSDLRRLCDGLDIGPDNGSCGSAAFHNRTSFAHDVTTDARWQRFKDVAVANGVRASWSVPIRSAGGDVVGTFAMYHPHPHTPDAGQIAVVERAAVLAGLCLDREQREELLASIQRNINEGLFRSVPGQGIVHVNEAFARMFGHGSPTELLRALRERHADEGTHLDALAHLADANTPASQVEVELQRRDGTRFHGLVSKTIVRDDVGAPLLCDGTVTDVTARKELESQLLQAQKMEALGQLAGGIAHDFNNLLTAIAGYGEAARDQVAVDDPVRRDLEEILRATDRAAALTRQMLAFSRRQVLQPRVVDLVAVVEQVSAMLRRLIGEQHTLVTRHAEVLLPVRVDRAQVEQLLLNLVVNARDAMPNGGTITIATAAIDVVPGEAGAPVDLRPGPHALVAVGDTGTGMTAEVRARAFDPFFTTKEPGKGTGLGLSMVYGIVRQSGGAASIDSSPGKGTTVSIHLPQVAAAPDQEPEVRIPTRTRSACTLLVVEDEELVRELTQRALTRAGHVVLTAGDGHAALEVVAARAGAIDLVISDVVMPRMGGRELASRLRLGWPTIPVLLMSGYVDDPAKGCGDAELGELLPKPFTATELVDAVNRALLRAVPTAPAAIIASPATP